MTVATYHIPGGARVLIFTCACGEPAMYGTGCNIRSALKMGNVSLAGVWRCPKCQHEYEAKLKEDAA